MASRGVLTRDWKVCTHTTSHSCSLFVLYSFLHLLLSFIDLSIHSLIHSCVSHRGKIVVVCVCVCVHVPCWLTAKWSHPRTHRGMSWCACQISAETIHAWNPFRPQSQEMYLMQMNACVVALYLKNSIACTCHVLDLCCLLATLKLLHIDWVAVKP